MPVRRSRRSALRIPALSLPLTLPGRRRRILLAPPGRARRTGHRRLAAALGAVLLVGGLATAARGELATRAADAAVTPTSGFAGTVAGWTSWYGAYDLADLGWAWCIDHGSSAPDPDLVYAPTTIDAETGADTRAAMAWAVGMNPPHDPVTAAGLMLALHHLRGAVYPSGPLDLDRLGPADLAGFDGAEAAVLDRGRAILGDARAHARLRAPFALRVAADRAAAGSAGALRLTLTDATGAAVGGIPVEVAAQGAALAGGPVVVTGDDGTAWVGFQAGSDNAFAARAVLPSTDPQVFAPTVSPAQRVIVPSTIAVDGADRYAAVPPTTTTTTRPPTTTTAPPPTTTTTRPSTTTTRPTTTTTAKPPTTTTTRPPTTTSSSTTSTVPAPTTSTTTTSPPPPTSSPPPSFPPPTVPRSPAPPSAPPRPSLPQTGRTLWPWALVGLGLIAVGWALTGSSRRSPERDGGP